MAMVLNLTTIRDMFACYIIILLCLVLIILIVCMIMIVTMLMMIMLITVIVTIMRHINIILRTRNDNSSEQQ